jgi:hypothetical protein
MTKTDIIKAIAEQSHHKTVVGEFGKAVVNACIEQLNQPLDIERIRPLIDSIQFLIVQIENCEKRAQHCHNIGSSPWEMDEQDYIRQANKYRESLTKTLEQL